MSINIPQSTPKKKKINLKTALLSITTALWLAFWSPAETNAQNTSPDKKPVKTEQVQKTAEKIDIKKDPLAYGLQNFKTIFPNDEASYKEYTFMIGHIQKDSVWYNKVTELLLKYVVSQSNDPHDQVFGMRFCINECMFKGNEWITQDNLAKYEPHNREAFEKFSEFDTPYLDRSKEYKSQKEQEIAKIRKETEILKEKNAEWIKAIKEDLMKMDVAKVKNDPLLIKKLKIAQKLNIQWDTPEEKAHIKKLYEIIK